MNKTDLESKTLSDLHQLASAASVERYRMLTRAELIERLGDGDGGGSASSARSAKGDEDRPERPRRSRSRRSRSGSGSGGREREERTDAEEEEEKQEKPAREKPERSKPARERTRAVAPSAASDEDSDDDDGESRPRRRRRRRPFSRNKRDGIAIQDLLLPADSGRQVVLLAETREGATELLRGVAAELAGADEGPDPVALLIDPSPEELADWKREAPQAELVSAGQARHATDALASAQRRAGEGEDVILLVDSLSRFTDSFGDAEKAKELFDAGRTGKASAKGSLTVVVALERN
jgi:hypothetical protein